MAKMRDYRGHVQRRRCSASRAAKPSANQLAWEKVAARVVTLWKLAFSARLSRSASCLSKGVQFGVQMGVSNGLEGAGFPRKSRHSSAGRAADL